MIRVFEQNNHSKSIFKIVLVILMAIVLAVLYILISGQQSGLTASLSQNSEPSDVLLIPASTPSVVDLSTQSSLNQSINAQLINNDFLIIEDGKVHALSFVSVDFLNNNILASKDEQKELPIASLTKLMTAMIVLERYNLNDSVTISDKAMTVFGEQGSLKAGQKLSVENLLYIMLVESSNRAAYALAEVMGVDDFIKAMNDNAKSIGLNHTHFADVSGLSAESRSTSYDIAQLVRYLFGKYPLFSHIISLKEFDLYLADKTFHHKLINTNQVLGENGIIGGKTGYTNEAGGCFMAISQDDKNGQYKISVVLGTVDRFLEMKKIIHLVSNNP